MWNKPTINMLNKVPNLYSQEKKEDPKVYMKFFIGSFTWYVTEIDHRNMDIMFCLVVSDQVPNGEFGYTSLRELMAIRNKGIEVDREIHQVNPYEPKKLSVLLKQDGIHLLR